ncbi:uncharacterized protein BP5553_01281 [Venustampulla echinocandica]|uniref:BD-FAE-like domain-containing protein n=1 Tax=Venustampulla echinocandica TaxID=2656787 RepID=A0A370U0J5_9HELO|nr:uncharacterized protein BP5553_01281 [Venustampulla echinocandica]RDL41302.1 hypothetical protein BP5553_01281 [Venustampulla echinocandica]
MDQIRTLQEKVGPSIFSVLGPTFKIYSPLLVANKERILAIPPKTESYGSHPRQALDVYLASDSSKTTTPILVFFYGGGFTTGEKITQTIDDGLLYHNLGTFFASHGVTTIIPDYRLVNVASKGHDAVFPSGGDDVSLVLKWVAKTFAGEGGKRDVFIMGNSAGGVHISTFLFESQYLEQRKSYIGGDAGITLKGAIELSAPFHFGQSVDENAEMLAGYFGTVADAGKHCPYVLLKEMGQRGESREDVAVPKILTLVGEWEPEQIPRGSDQFVELWKKTWGEGIESGVIAGHNHISPPCGLMAGEPAGEKWGEDVVKWIRG